MSVYVIENGKVRKSSDVQFADKIAKLKRDQGPWAVIDELVKVWAQKAPDEEKALRIQIDEQRQLLKDQTYGTTTGGGDVNRRLTMMFPHTLQLMIRSQYKPDELPFDQPFYREFLKRYPMFKVPDKI